MHSGGVPGCKRCSIAWRRRRQRSHGWRNNCHFLLTKILNPVTCWMTVLLQSFFASFIHVTFALPLGIRAQLPSQQTIVVMLSAKKKLWHQQRSIRCMSAPFTPIPTVLVTSGHSRDTTCCRPQGLWVAVSISVPSFAPWKCPNKSPKQYRSMEGFLPLQPLVMYQFEGLIYIKLLVLASRLKRNFTGWQKDLLLPS